MFSRERGDITHLGPQLDPAMCGQIANRVFAVIDESVEIELFQFHRTIRIDWDERALDIPLEISMYRLPLDDVEVEFLADAHTRFTQAYNGGLFRREPHMSLFCGTPGSKPIWHIDPEDNAYRVLVNMTDGDYELDKALDWGRLRYSRGLKKGSLDGVITNPTAIFGHETLTLGQGEGLLIDNNHSKRKRRPHRGHSAERKLFLRTMY